MADNDYRLSAVGDELFEPLDRLDVEVVGRFVEEEYVGRPEEEFLASSMRIRHPPENWLVGRLKSERWKPSPSSVFSTCSSKWVESMA